MALLCSSWNYFLTCPSLKDTLGIDTPTFQSLMEPPSGGLLAILKHVDSLFVLKWLGDTVSFFLFTPCKVVFVLLSYCKWPVAAFISLWTMICSLRCILLVTLVFQCVSHLYVKFLHTPLCMGTPEGDVRCSGASD